MPPRPLRKPPLGCSSKGERCKRAKPAACFPAKDWVVTLLQLDQMLLMKYVQKIKPSLWGTQLFHPRKDNIQLPLPIWVHGWCLKPTSASGAKMAMVPGNFLFVQLHVLVHQPTNSLRLWLQPWVNQSQANRSAVAVPQQPCGLAKMEMSEWFGCVIDWAYHQGINKNNGDVYLIL